LPPETFLGLKNPKNAFAVEAPPQTPLGELTALSRLPSWIREGGGRREGKVNEGIGRQRMGGKRRRRERRGREWREGRTFKLKVWLRP